MKLDPDFIYTVSGLEVSCRVFPKVPDYSKPVWDFGDNTEPLDEPYLGQEITHTYEKSGFYIITLLFEDQVERKTIEKLVVVSEFSKTHLTGSIYHLIDAYIPKELSLSMSPSDKSLYINKWQLYLQPLVNHDIPLDKYNDELYYEGLENQLIMELAVYDFVYNKIMNMLGSTANALANYASNSGSSDGTGNEEATGRIKQITTGPTEVQYFDQITDGISSLFKAYSQATQKGGWLDQFRVNICMLASRLEIWLPICDQSRDVVVPKVTNRRDPGLLGGPNPPSLVFKGGNSIIPE